MSTQFVSIINIIMPKCQTVWIQIRPKCLDGPGWGLGADLGKVYPQKINAHPVDIPSFRDYRTIVNVLKFQTLVAYQKRSRQTGKTKIRLLLKKQSDQGLPCLLF